MKYTKDILQKAVLENISLAGVLRSLNLRQSGGMQAHISRRIKFFEISTSHFLGLRTNSGINHKGNKKSYGQVLIKKESGKRQKAVVLRRALYESGEKYECIICKNKGEWEGKILILQVNHIDGNWLDNRKENLEFLCPNCHSQTNGWSGSQGGTDHFSSSKQFQRQKQRQKQRLDDEKSSRIHAHMAEQADALDSDSSG